MLTPFIALRSLLPLRRALALEKAVEETPEELLARESTEVNRFVGGALAELQRTVVELGGKVKRVREWGREGEERAAVGVVRVSDAACCSCIACLVLTHCPHTQLPFRSDPSIPSSWPSKAVSTPATAPVRPVRALEGARSPQGR